MPVDWPELLERLAQPFDPKTLQHHDHAGALLYARASACEERLNSLCPGAWSVSFTPWNRDRVICTLTIHDLTRSATGESKSAITTEAEAFTRACAGFGLGSYLDLPSPAQSQPPTRRSAAPGARQAPLHHLT